MKTKSQSSGILSSFSIILVCCAIIAFTFFFVVCGSPSNFNESGRPLPGNVYGILYQGGYVIPVVMTLLLTVVCLVIERLIALRHIKGRGRLGDFIYSVKEDIDRGDLDSARRRCDSQQGSVANVLTSALLRYEDIDGQSLSNDEKAELIQNEVDAATALEMPGMERNLNIIAAISTLGTLMGLFGTVLGMIKSFSAMGHEGSPDSTTLAVGISEALLNTAMGIGTGALAIIFYTFLTGRVQNLVNAIDEAGFSIGQSFTRRQHALNQQR